MSVSFDGASGKLAVAARDPAAPGFLRWGRLTLRGRALPEVSGRPILDQGRHQHTREPAGLQGVRRYSAQSRFRRPRRRLAARRSRLGSRQGQGLVGLLNYLASHHVNSIYFMTMNIGGDGKDVWPWTGSPEHNGSPSNDNLHYDISKLGQWEQVFAHAQRNGIQPALRLERKRRGQQART